MRGSFNRTPLTAVAAAVATILTGPQAAAQATGANSENSLAGCAADRDRGQCGHHRVARYPRLA